MMHYWSGGKAAVGFGDRVDQNLVSIVTDISHRVLIEKAVFSLFLECLRSNFILTVLGR